MDKHPTFASRFFIKVTLLFRFQIDRLLVFAIKTGSFFMPLPDK